MIRILEILVSLVIVAILGLIVAVLLPDHGHVERSVKVSSPVRQIYDSLDTFRRFPEWTSLRTLDPNLKMTEQGPESGKDAQVNWTSSTEKVGNGSLKIIDAVQDQKVVMALDNHWAGLNKTLTFTINPDPNGRTTQITGAVDADYGWDLMARYRGLYIHGDPANMVQTSLNDLATMMAGFPDIDYKDQQIAVTDVAAKPVFLVDTKANRTLDEVADATNTAMQQIDAAMKKAGLTAAGPRMTIATDFGEEAYTFSVAVPVSAVTFTMDKKDYTIEAPPPPSGAPAETDSAAGSDTAPALNPGDKDPKGLLVVDANVRAAIWYQGKALETDYTGSPAALPLLRRDLKAYAETHGYHYSEAGLGRYWDELTSAPDAAEDQQSFKVYLPIQL